jgi:hypothetical protein
MLGSITHLLLHLESMLQNIPYLYQSVALGTLDEKPVKSDSLVANTPPEKKKKPPPDKVVISVFIIIIVYQSSI